MGRCDAKDRSGVPDHRQCLQGSHDGADWLGRFPIGRGDAKKQHRGSGDDMARDHRVVKGEPREQGQWRLPAKRLLDDGSRQLCCSHRASSAVGCLWTVGSPSGTTSKHPSSGGDEKHAKKRSDDPVDRKGQAECQQEQYDTQCDKDTPHCFRCYDLGLP